MSRWAEPDIQQEHEKRLRKIEKWRDRAEKRERKHHKDRDEAIHEAVAAGLTQAAIARATNLTRSRVGQILEGE